LVYLRTKDGKEIDFCISQKDEIVTAIEIKSSELEASKNCIYFYQKYNLPITQLVRYARKESIDRGIPILPLELGLEKLIL
jgi:hypothetical protein